MNIIGIKETCIYTKDLESARQFYCEVLGLPLIHFMPGKHLFLRAGHSVLLIFDPDDAKVKTSPPGHFGQGKLHFAFEVETKDFGQTKAKLIGKGVNIIDQVTWKSGKESFYFNDPAGNVLEIVPDEGIWD